MDTSRYFSNPFLTIQQRQQQPPAEIYLSSSIECMKHAKALYERCINKTKSRDNNNINLGTLYHGKLGPQIYLRYRMAKTLQVCTTIQTTSSSSSNNNTETASSLIMKEALEMAKQSMEYEYQKIILEKNNPHSNFRYTSRISLLEGSYVGSKALYAVILYAFDELDKAKQQAIELIEHLRNVCINILPAEECDVLYGRAGAIQTILFIRSEMNDKSLGSNIIIELATQIIQQGHTTAAQTARQQQEDNTNIIPPLLWKWHNKIYLGAAHGIVGILHTLLQINDNELRTALKNVYNGNDSLDPIQQTIDILLQTQCFPISGNLYSSWNNNKIDKLVHWCHGAPGHVLLLIKAANIFHNDMYLNIAKDITNNTIWVRGLLHKGVGLCHGITGNAYIFLSLLNNNNNMMYRQRAVLFTQFALKHLSQLEHIPDNPYSIYEGMAGLVLLLLDLSLLLLDFNDTSDDTTTNTSTFNGFPLYEYKNLN